MGQHQGRVWDRPGEVEREPANMEGLGNDGTFECPLILNNESPELVRYMIEKVDGLISARTLACFNDILMNKKYSFPCVFLSSYNSCMIYNSRPTVCRTHGSCKVVHNGYCNMIEAYSEKLWLADISDFYNGSIDCMEVGDIKINFRLYPIIYYIYGCKDEIKTGKVAVDYRKLNMSKEIYIKNTLKAKTGNS